MFRSSAPHRRTLIEGFRPLWLSDPWPPSSPHSSPNVMLWEAHADAGINSADYNRVLSEQLARLAGAIGPAGCVTDSELRSAINLDVEDLRGSSDGGRLLGRWDDNREWFTPGLIGLSAQEHRALELWLEGHPLRDIAGWMDRRAASQAEKFGQPIDTTTVATYLSRAWLKVLVAFRLPMGLGRPEKWQNGPAPSPATEQVAV